MVTPLVNSCADKSHAGRPDWAAALDDFLGELTIEQASVEKIVLKPSGSKLGGFGQEAMFYVAEGEAVFRLEESEYTLDRGGLFHLRPNVACIARAGLGQPCVIVELRFTALILGEVSFSELVEFPAAIEPGVNSIVGQYFLEAMGLAEMAPIGRRQCLRSLTTLAIISFVRDHIPDAGRMLGRAQVIQIRRLLPAIRLLRTNVGSPHTVQTLAQGCGLSVAQFRRLFCAMFAMSPTRYIQRLRVREACRLLNYSDQTVSEICLRIGYEQPSHFHKTFKRIVGLTPRTYREELLARRQLPAARCKKGPKAA
ncbi:MAG TPA: AraC family transcriptional regulator [Lacunisphaera sp.]